MQVLLAQPRGFCAGVTRAIDVVEQALKIFGSPVYVLHEIVHNQHVVNDLRTKGAVFTEDLATIPSGAVTIFSAHGVSDQRVDEARARGLKVIDATCPLVTKVHLQAQKYHRLGYELIIVGHPGHPEVEGTRGRIADPVQVISTAAQVATLAVRDPEKVAYVTQTTLSVDDTRAVIAALRTRFPAIVGPDIRDICYATQNRQNAVRELAKDANVIVVVGAPNSSNSNRLREVGAQAGARAYLVRDANDLDPAWLTPADRVGVTAGASTPETLVDEVLAKLAALGATVHKIAGPKEHVKFSPPPELAASAAKAIVGG